jgi:hypothetical protein
MSQSDQVMADEALKKTCSSPNNLSCWIRDWHFEQLAAHSYV